MPAEKKRKKNKKRQRVQSMRESFRTNKKTTFSGKSNPYKRRTRTTKSSKTSAQASNSKDQRLRGFWSKCKEEQSKKLWWPTKTDWHASQRTLLNGSLNKPAPLSSFKITQSFHPNRNSLKTSWRSSTYSLAGSTEKENTAQLSKREKQDRKNAYKNKSHAEKKMLKKQFDAKKQSNATANRCRLLRLKLTPKQHRLLFRWFSDARRTYNMATDYVLKHGFHRPNSIDSLSELEKKLQKTFVRAQALAGRKRQFYLLRTPKVIRQQAVKSVISNLKAFATNHKKRLYLRALYPNARKFKKDVRFNPKFKTKRRWTSDSVYVEKCSVRYVDPTHFSLYKTLDPQLWMGAKQPLKKKKKNYLFRSVQLHHGGLTPASFKRDIKLHYKFGRFYLILPRQERLGKHDSKVCREPDSIAAVDPGVRKFLTVYSPEGRAEVLGENTTRVLDRCIRRIDRAKKKRQRAVATRIRYKRMVSTRVLIKERKLYRGKRRAFLRPHPVHRLKKLQSISGRSMKKKMRNRIWRLTTNYRLAELKATHVVKNLHYNAAHYLCRRYRTILYPSFNAKAIAQGGTLRKTVKRRLNMLSFYKFKCRLLETASWYSSVNIKVGSEAYTSKQCGQCGFLNETLGGAELFECANCNAKGDRDVHAARNILLRFMQPAGQVFMVSKNSRIN